MAIYRRLVLYWPVPECGLSTETRTFMAGPTLPPRKKCFEYFILSLVLKMLFSRCRLIQICLDCISSNVQHLNASHAWMGLATMLCSFLPAIAGSVFLHPDFGIDKTNKLYRFLHKWCSRTAIAGAYVTGYWGLTKMSQDPLVLALYTIPLVILTPFTLL